jgi:hypothetical protein
LIEITVVSVPKEVGVSPAGQNRILATLTAVITDVFKESIEMPTKGMGNRWLSEQFEPMSIEHLIQILLKAIVIPHILKHWIMVFWRHR